MPLTQPIHDAAFNRIGALLVLRLGRRATVRFGHALKLGPHSELQPAIVLARYRRDFYKSAHPTADDALVTIEVSDSTLRTDRLRKLPICARHGMPEAWIVDVQDEAVEVYTGPTPEGYTDLHTFGRGEEFAPQALPDVVITADDLLGEA